MPSALSIRFTRQRQTAWRPVLSGRQSVFFGIATALITLGFGIYFLSRRNSIPDLEFRYDLTCPLSNFTCRFPISIPRNLEGTIHFQYKLTPYPQNHRRLILSRVPDQLRGDFVDFDDVKTAKPFRSIDDSPDPENWILPSGAFAYYAFNDTFTLPFDFDEASIAFPEETSYTFQPLNALYENSTKWIENSPAFPGNETDPHFIVWMRTSATQTIVKDYAICQNCVIKQGDYFIEINANYPADFFRGEKSIVFAEDPVNSQYLCIVSLTVAAVSFLYGVVWLCADLVAPRVPVGTWGMNPRILQPILTGAGPDSPEVQLESAPGVYG
jgi:hypothetical protein